MLKTQHRASHRSSLEELFGHIDDYWLLPPAEEAFSSVRLNFATFALTRTQVD
ncbi:hypothetical protein [Moorena producens]|uniref:hypothetical protein n=1 Tax=Moorena producens TaxID=1155739 RepID=UPI0013148891|nr:hypothetical protein [Moorena producens]